MSKIKSFYRETKAALLGDTDGVVTEKNYRKAKATIESQISALKYQRVTEEEELATAKEALLAAKHPGKRITDGETYLTNIRDCHDTVEMRQEAIDETDASVKFYQDLIAEFDEEVEEA